MTDPQATGSRAAIEKRIRDHFQPIGCGMRIGMPGRETTCGDRGICSACFDRRNRRDEALALLLGDSDD